MWALRRGLWDRIARFKYDHARPATIPVPGGDTRRIGSVQLSAKFPDIPIHGVMVGDRVPSDEAQAGRLWLYRIQGLLGKIFSPMQEGGPRLPADMGEVLRVSYGEDDRRRFPAPVRPAEMEPGSDLGVLATTSPYAGYTERAPGGGWQWDLRSLRDYEHHPGLRSLGVHVRFELDGAARRLRATRIESELGVSRPGDPSWAEARRVVMCAVSTHTSLVRHYNHVHLASSEPVAIACRNQLPPDHPVARLMWPHHFGTQATNEVTTMAQLRKDGDFPVTFSLTHAGVCRLFTDTFKTFDLAVNHPALYARRRGADGSEFDHPTLDNLTALFDVLERHARRYLDAHYDSDAALAADASVRAWLDELGQRIPNGIESVLGADVTREAVARLAASFMYLGSVHHDLIGTTLWNYQLWIDVQPVRVYVDGSRERADVYQRLINSNLVLNVKRKQLTDDFSYLGLDAKGQQLFRQFREALQALDQKLSAQGNEPWRLKPTLLEANVAS